MIMLERVTDLALVDLMTLNGNTDIYNHHCLLKTRVSISRYDLLGWPDIDGSACTSFNVVDFTCHHQIFICPEWFLAFKEIAASATIHQRCATSEGSEFAITTSKADAAMILLHLVPESR